MQLGRLLIPSEGAYTGAYLAEGEREDRLSYDNMESFEKLVGKRQAVVAFSNDWGQDRFPIQQLQLIREYGAMPLLYWHPWHPGLPKGQPNPFSLDRILAGQFDGYIDRWATSAKAWGDPILVSWGMEMNGNWFPWSGQFHGGGSPVPGGTVEQFQGPETYKKAFRYVVDRVRRQGASNIQWIFHANNHSVPFAQEAKWNRIARYYPGDDYVDWIGVSAYGKQFPNQQWQTFAATLDDSYADLTALTPDKPFILAEWGVGEFPDAGDKGLFMREGFQRLTSHYPRLKAAVYWQERWQNPDLSYSNIRVQSSMGSLEAYRQGVAEPFWLDRPQYQHTPTTSASGPAQ